MTLAYRTALEKTNVSIRRRVLTCIFQSRDPKLALHPEWHRPACVYLRALHILDVAVSPRVGMNPQRLKDVGETCPECVHRRIIEVGASQPLVCRFRTEYLISVFGPLTITEDYSADHAQRVHKESS
jgi:hypothetical protein